MIQLRFKQATMYSLFTKSAAVLLLLFICSVQQGYSQLDKRLALADQYFAAGEYFTAAQLYEQFLNPLEKNKTIGGFPVNPRRNVQGGTGNTGSRMDVLFKQADSYRLAFYLLEASARYKECFEKAPDTYPAAYYWHAVCQRGLGFYDVAAASLQTFLDKYAAGQPALKPAAEEEFKTLQFIRSQLKRPDTILYRIGKANAAFGGEKGVFAPLAVSGDRYLVTSTQTLSQVPAGTSPYRNRLFYATRSGGSLQQPETVQVEGLDSTSNQGAASLSADGRTLYFTQWKKVNGANQSAIWVARKKGDGWEQPQLLQSVNTAGYSSKQPFCTPDGKYLLFASDRPGGQGKWDLWMAVLQPDGSTGTPENLGPNINTVGDEQAPFYHATSGTLVFATNGRTGMGGFDLFRAKGWGTGWELPVNMGYPVNSTRDDVYYFVSQQGELLQDGLISSDRGSNCCLETYAVDKQPKKRFVTGVVRDCNTNEPVNGAEVVVADGAGGTQRLYTNSEGQYRFELKGEAPAQQLTINREYYKEKITGITIGQTNEVDPLTDTLYSELICMEKKVVIKPEEVVILYFDFDKSVIKPRGREQLDSIYQVLVDNPSATIQISGHTDGLGSVDYNLKLGDRRAKACADYLIRKGIAAERISFESFGKCCPVEMELINGRDNPDGRSRNRRALINITK
ncbi:MAG TPA: OmpA family protein [Lacibacter sp.]|nr:OmpA family protein [Lacibacter sp.]HMO88273.1 OmpA family protein [Lacibacter sp.]HMP87054.1 OmpA family protein [Lacibacter sp.]